MAVDTPHPTRRRVIAIVAACAGLAAGGRFLGGGNARAAEPVVWEGTALGAQSSIRLYHPDRAEALDLIAACVADVERLEKVFSLHRPDSALVRLNRDGVLHDPPPDLVRLLTDAGRFSRLSDGAFDATVQPLWELYASHFARAGADRAGPPADALAKVLARVGHGGVQVAPDRVALARPNMAVTLNGIAQGYITDRVAELLRRGGVDAVLLNLGEVLAIGRKPDGDGFTIGIADPTAPSRMIATLTVADGQALATSGAYGCRFAPGSSCHHLFNPATGRSANRWASVSVTAATATAADALSTALGMLPPDRIASVLAAAGGGCAVLVDADNRLHHVAG